MISAMVFAADQLAGFANAMKDLFSVRTRACVTTFRRKMPQCATIVEWRMQEGLTNPCMYIRRVQADLTGARAHFLKKKNKGEENPFQVVMSARGACSTWSALAWPGRIAKDQPTAFLIGNKN